MEVRWTVNLEEFIRYCLLQGGPSFVYIKHYMHTYVHVQCMYLQEKEKGGERKIEEWEEEGREEKRKGKRKEREERREKRGEGGRGKEGGKEEKVLV